MFKHFIPLIVVYVLPIVVWILMVRTMKYLRFDWIKRPQLRIIWTLILFSALIYALYEPSVYGVIMKLKGNVSILRGYLIAGIFGASAMCVFWHITGLALGQNQKPTPVLEAKQGDYTKPHKAEEKSVDPEIQAQRPWLEIANVKIGKPLTITEKEFSTELIITIINRGNTPATDIMVASQMVVIPIPGKKNKSSEMAVRKAIEINKLFNTDFGDSRPKISSISLFPKILLVQRHIVTFPRSEIISTNTDGNLNVLIGGCVDYQFAAFSAGKGQTTFNFNLREDWAFFDINPSPRIIPVEKLRLWPETGGVWVK
jgi:hypothetical protein